MGQDKWPEACLPPAHLALRTHSIWGPHPGPGLIPGWQQPGEQKVCLSASAATPSPASAWDPSQGLLWLPGPGLSVAMAPAGDEALGGSEGWWRPGTLQLPRCWGPSRGRPGPRAQRACGRAGHTPSLTACTLHLVLHLQGPRDRPQGRSFTAGARPRQTQAVLSKDIRLLHHVLTLRLGSEVAERI